MNITFQTKEDFEEQSELLELIGGKVRNIDPILQIACPFMFAAAVMVPALIFNKLGIGIFFSLLVFGWITDLLLKNRKLLADFRKRVEASPIQSVSINEENITISDGTNVDEISWDSFSYHHIADLSCIIMVDKFSGIVIPSRETSKFMTRTEFNDFIKSKIPHRYIRGRAHQI